VSAPTRTAEISVGRDVRRTQIERRTEAERALLEAAVHLIAAKGVDQTSLAEIGERAGFSRGLVNHHFGSKATLMERLAARTQQGFVDNIESAGVEDELEALVRLARAYLDAVRDGGDVVRAFFVMWGAATATEAPLRAVFVADDERFRDTVGALVATGQARGAIAAEVNPVGFAVSFVAMLRGAAAQYLVDEGVDLTAARDTCERFIRLMLTPT
jgi:AcrR family transcriptional regulator